MAEIETTGRGAGTSVYGKNDLEEFFKKSGVIEAVSLDHMPFLAFRDVGDRIVVDVVRNAYRLTTAFPPETKVMVQWPGRWRSDYFQMTVADVLRELERRTETEQGDRAHERSAKTPAELDVEAIMRMPGRCTDCGRRTGEEEVDGPCRMPQPRGGYCRGRIMRGERR